jgi:hypothetical protein
MIFIFLFLVIVITALVWVIIGLFDRIDRAKVFLRISWCMFVCLENSDDEKHEIKYGDLIMRVNVRDMINMLSKEIEK